MPTASRDRVLADYCVRLSGWGSREVVRLWRTVDPADVRGSWLRIAPAVEQVHRALIVQALTAVDGYMLGAASEAGFVWDVTWRDDLSQRPYETYWGERATSALGRAPVVVLSRIGRGDPVEVAMLAGLNYLLSIVGTEAHQIHRTVLLDRMLAQ